MRDHVGEQRIEARGADPRENDPPGVVSLPGVVGRPSPPDLGSFILLQQFEGSVLEIQADAFTARLVDRTNPLNPPEIGDFSVEDVATGDRELLARGAVFYFSIGYRIASGGQRVRVATIKFRRLPAWSKRELAAARERAARWAYLLAGEEAP